MGATTCNMAKFLSAIGLLFVAALALAAPTPTQNIVQLAAGIPDLSTLVTALKAGNLVTALSDPGPFTVFAPTNEAFAALPNGTLASLLEPKNIKQLQSILEYHVIPGAAVRAEDLKASQDVKTLEGQAVHINKISGSVTVQNAKVIKADVGATNGVVHVINSVLTPPTTFDSAVQPIQNGERNIVQLLSNDPELSTLVAALTAAKLTDALSGSYPGISSWTVFAPTNKAFSALPAATLAHLLLPSSIKELQAVLELHVLRKSIQSKDLTGVEPTLLKGKSLIIGGQGSSKNIAYAVGAKDAKIILVDLEASNGVVHVIDRVMYVAAKPGSTRSIKELISRDPELSTLVAALTAANLVLPVFTKGVTLFAPTNKAFSLLPPAVLADLLLPKNIEQLVGLLKYHVLTGAFSFKELVQGGQQDTLTGQPVVLKQSLSNDGVTGALLVNDALATFVDLQASDGVVHVIDQVLLPTFTSSSDLMEVVASQPQLSTFATALNAGAMTGTLKGNGKLQRFQVDNTVGAKGDDKPIWDKFINQCAYGQRGPSIFNVPSNGALCPYTVFAPTNEAFAKLPKATLEHLLNPDNQGELQEILELHIIPGVALESQRLRETEFPVGFTQISIQGFYSTLLGNTDLNFVPDGEFFPDKKYANGTTLLSNDIFYDYPEHIPKQYSAIVLGNLANLGASNGIVHIIDSVLIPLAATKTIVQELEEDEGLTTMLAALKAANLLRTLNDTATGPYTVFAPTNGAFAALPKATLKHLLDPRNIGELQDLLEYHIIADHGIYKHGALAAGQALRTGCVNTGRPCLASLDLEAFNGTTLMGKKVTITPVGEAGVDGSIMIDKSNVIGFENSAFDGTGNFNHRASNGNWIKIDQVLTKHYMPTLV